MSIRENTMTLKPTFMLALCLTLTSGAWAQNQDVNDKKFCGSGFTEKLVPEAPLGCQMADSCKTHDICYGKCDPGGSKYGSDYCKKSEFSMHRMKEKIACDQKFYASIDQQNNGRWQCRALGGMYAAAVVIAGQGPFNGKPMPPSAMADLIETSQSSGEAINKFQSLAHLSQQGKLDLSQIRRDGSVLRVQPQPILLSTGMSNADLKKMLGADFKKQRGFIGSEK